MVQQFTFDNLKDILVKRVGLPVEQIVDDPNITSAAVKLPNWRVRPRASTGFASLHSPRAENLRCPIAGHGNRGPRTRSISS